MALYNDKKAALQEGSTALISRCSPLSTPSTPSQELLPEMKVCLNCFAVVVIVVFL